MDNATASNNRIEAKYNLDVQKCVYYYPNKVTCSCGNLITLNTIKPTYQIITNKTIINNFLESNTCSNCDNTITNDMIAPNLVAYLEPTDIVDVSSSEYTVYLFCPICGEDTGYYIKVQCAIPSMNPFFKVDSFGGTNSHDLNKCKLTSNNNLQQDLSYCRSQLNKRYNKNLITIN